MKVRMKKDHTITGFSNRLNDHGMGEIIVGYDEGDMSSDYITEYEVQLRDGTWMDLSQAFKENRVVTDNYCVRFREALNEEEKERGWYE